MEANFAKLFQCLEIIGRYDVIEDLNSAFERDARAFASQTASATVNKIEFNIEIITRYDQQSVEEGLPLKKFDALVMYHENDVEFVIKLRKYLEDDRGYSLCYKDRDMIAGTSFGSNVMASFIEKRCKRLSSSFRKIF